MIISSVSTPNLLAIHPLTPRPLICSQNVVVVSTDQLETLMLLIKSRVIRGAHVLLLAGWSPKRKRYVWSQLPISPLIQLNQLMEYLFQVRTPFDLTNVFVKDTVMVRD